MNDGFYISGLLVAIGVLTYLFRNTPNPYIGVRLGYTYLSKEAWREANTFAGVYSIVIGVIIGAITYLLNPPREILLLLFLIAIGILAVTTYLKAKEAYERAEFRVPLEESPKPLTTANVKPYLMVQLIAVGIYFLIVALLWNKLPEEIAVYYSSNGIPDNFAPKVMGAFVYPLAGFIIMPLFTILISKVPMLMRFPVFGKEQVLTLAFLTIMHLSIVVIVSMSLLYNVGMVSEGWIRGAAMGIVVVTIVWAYWMWKHYKSTPLEE